MHIFRTLYCPRCKAMTYHFFVNPLRDRFAAKSRWVCYNCYRAEAHEKGWPTDEIPEPPEPPGHPF